MNKNKNKCVTPATFTVTCALEEVRKRGFLHRADMRGMSSAEQNAYVDLAKRELNVSSWAPDA